MAAFVRPQAAPVIAVGGAFIDRTPSALKNFAVEHFGENDKTVLLLGMYAMIAVIAMVIGCLARRNATIGVAGIAVFGLFGAFVAITRPEGQPTDVVPSVIGGLAGIAAFLWLASAAAPITPLSACRSGPPAPGGHREGMVTVNLDRRKFLAAAAAPPAAAAAAGVGGELLISKRFDVNTSTVRLAPPAVKPRPWYRRTSR